MDNASFSPAAALSLMTVALLLMLAVDLMLHETVAEIFDEDQAIELFTGMLYVVAAIVLVATRPTGRLRSEWHLPVILVLMALREFDLDKKLTSEGVLQLSLYSGPALLAEKLAGAAIIALILVCGWRLVRHTGPAFLRGLRAMAPASHLCLFAAAGLAFSKTLDGLDRKLAALGFGIDAKTATLTGRFEEMLELAASMMLMMAVVYANRRPNPSHRSRA